MMGGTFRLLLVVLVSFSGIFAAGQDFRFKAELAPVDSTGFYGIVISAKLSSYIAPAFNDVRIYDQNKLPVPYILRTEAKPSFTTEYRKLGIYSQQRTDSNQTILVLENELKEQLNNIGLLLKNAAVTRAANISGSDDARNWYTISEDVLLTKNYYSAKDEYVEYLQIPLSSYRFFRITINNGRNDQLNILSAGYTISSGQQQPATFIRNGRCVIEQRDSSDNNSYVYIRQAARYHTEKLVLTLDAPKYFQRDAELVLDKHSYHFQLSSGRPSELEFPISNSMNYMLKIYNRDNAPIKVMAVESQQLKKQLISWLQHGKAYHLLMGNERAPLPDYDLKSFNDSITNHPAPLAVKNIITLPHNNSSKGLQSQVWLWLAIIIVVSVLGLLTYKLVREVKKQQ